MAYVFAFGQGKADGDPKRKDILGGKGAGLAEMTSLGLPVPPGFTLSTEVCHEFHKGSDFPSSVKDEVRIALSKMEEHRRNEVRRREESAPRQRALRCARVDARHDGHDPEPRAQRCDRRGARGEDEEPALRLRRVSPLHRDVRRRRDGRLASPLRRAARRGAHEGRAAKGPRYDAHERRRAETRRSRLRDRRRRIEGNRSRVQGRRPRRWAKREFPSDPHEQLWGAVRAVFESWNNPRAIVYRRMHDIPDAWGTACNIQAMVFGNMGDTSATGVAFTRNPSTGEKAPLRRMAPERAR